MADLHAGVWFVQIANNFGQNHEYTDEQKAAVIRVRKCAHTAFYEILAIDKSSSEGEIKKAYRKLSLLTHPDKNGYEGADEAFKSRLLSHIVPIEISY